MNYVKVLGSSGSKTKIIGTTCFQVYKDIIIDAGNVINSLGDETLYIDHVFLTHSHSDHITDLPFIIEAFYESRKNTLKIYGSKETLDSLKKHTFNNEIWPDFSKINILGNENKKSLEFVEIKENETISLHQYNVRPIKVNHIDGAFGYVVEKEGFSYIVSGDTYLDENLINELKTNKSIKTLIIECSFPNKMMELALVTKHLTPRLLHDMISKINRNDIQIFIYHIKPLYKEIMKNELQLLGIFENGGKILNDGDVIHFDTGEIEIDKISHNKFERIMDINLELSSQLEKGKLFKMILDFSRDITNCEGGTLYIKSKDAQSLDFKIVQNSILKVDLNNEEKKISWPSLNLYDELGNPNNHMVATVCALENRVINIPDVYENKDYDFDGTKNFDFENMYRSKSMLVVPLSNHEGDVIGVLQLINKNKVLGKVIEFSEIDETIIKAIASQAAMALTNTQLIESLEEFLNSFVATIAHAIDAKSKHTRNHIGKVAKIATYLAQAINDDETIYKDVKYTENDFRQIELAAWVHDIGKISMPEYIIDKATKLESMIDRIDCVAKRFEILKRDLEIEFLKNNIEKSVYNKKIEKLDDDLKFLKKSNVGGEFMSDDDIQRVKDISKYQIIIDNKKIDLLTEDEVLNLTIRKGTLTNNEKNIMNGHAKLSLDMLKALPFPKKYSKVLNIAVNHHEKLNGKGYPRGLADNQLTLEDRIMILSDIFEALTSNDRPYKDAKKLSEVFKILSFMVKDGEIDGKLLKFFHENKILQLYAREELKDYQLDESKLLY